MMKSKNLLRFWTLLTAAMLTGCGSAADEPLLDGRVTVEIEEAACGNLSLEGKYIGTVASAETVEVVPQVAGVVTSVDVEVGQTVTTGQQLCKFDDSAAQNNLKNANVSYQSAVNSADSSTGSAWNLEREKENNSIESLESSRSEIAEKIDDYKDEKGDLREEKNKANAEMKKSQEAYEAAKAAYETALENEIPAEENGESVAEENPEISELEAKMNETKTAYEEAAQNYESVNASYQSAKASLNSSIDSLESQQKSLDEDIAHAREIQEINQTQVWQDRIAAAENTVEAARIGVEAAEYQLGLYTITSPVSGVVEQVNVTENNFATTGAVAFCIAADTEKVVTWYVTEDVRNEIAQGQEVSVEYNGIRYGGTISEIGTAVDLSKGLFKIKAIVSGMEEVSNGVSVEITFAAHSVQNQIVIPADAVYYDNGEAYVYVMKDQVAVKQSIRQGITDTEQTVVMEGLEAGEQVIISWSADLKDGAEVVTAEMLQEEAEENEAESQEVPEDEGL